MGAPYLQQWLWMLWMFLFFFPHCQEDFTPERLARRCWFNPVKSDYGGDPDDQQAMVRYLLDDLVTSPWRAMMVSKKGPILCWAPCAKRFKPGFRMRTWSELVPNTLTTSFRYQYQVSTGSVAFFFGWRYLISVVPWWGEKTRSCILWCTLTVKFGVFRGRHTVGRLQVTKCKYHLNFFLAIQLRI